MKIRNGSKQLCYGAKDQSFNNFNVLSAFPPLFVLKFYVQFCSLLFVRRIQFSIRYIDGIAIFFPWEELNYFSYFAFEISCS